MLECLNVRMFRLETTWTTGKNNLYLVRGLTRPRFFWVDLIRRRARASSPVRYAVRHLILTSLCASEPLCLCVNFITETQSFLHPSASLLLCPSAFKLFYRRVEIHFLILSILLILSKKWDSLPLCLCVNFITETQRHGEKVIFYHICLLSCTDFTNGWKSKQ